MMPPGPLESGENDTEKTRERISDSIRRMRKAPGEAGQKSEEGRRFARGSSGVMNLKKGGNQDVRY